MHVIAAQPYDGQRRQQRRPQHPPPQPFGALPATANVFMPDNQDTFTFSAEPTSIMYHGSMPMLPHTTTGHESVYTPHLGSSIDSSLHPDTLNYSYSSANAHAQTHNYSLSPASYNGNGQGIAPSHSVEHLSPEGDYMSDPSTHDRSAYPTPNFNPQQTNDTLANFCISDNDQVTAFPACSTNLDVPQLTSGTLNMFNAQLPTLPSNTSAEIHHQQLISPSVTNASSPIVGNEASAFQSMQYTGTFHSSTPPNTYTQLPPNTPSKQMQSPPLTNSPGNYAHRNTQLLRRQLTSPIVRVENYGRDESTDGEEENLDQVRVHPVVRSHERNEDGSWQTSDLSSQAGLSPDDRQAMDNQWVPSLGELVKQHAKQEKKREVQEWLTKSEAGSEAGDHDTRAEIRSSNTLLVPHGGRRRAKSTNDMHWHGHQDHLGLGLRADFHPYNDSGIPGPGVYIDEGSELDEYDYEDDESTAPESPAAAVDLRVSQEDTSYFPHQGDSTSDTDVIVKPWADQPVQAVASSTYYQPPTSNAAIMRFQHRAKDVESASLAATIGSRRLSESDLGSIRAAPGVARLIQPDPKKHKERQRRPSFLDTILPKRAPNNLLKRKGSIPVQQPQELTDKTKEVVIEKPKLMGSWSRPKSPRVDTNVNSHSKEAVSPHSNGLSVSNTGPWYHGARNAIMRTRSRSDIGKSPGLKELMTQHGGPPMPMLASPLADTEATKPSGQPYPLDEDDDEEHDMVQMDLKVRTDPIIPTYEGFRTHARQLNPRLADYMVERITQEQMRRYKRLLEFRVKHINAVNTKKCSSEGFCTELGGESQQLPPKASGKDVEAPFIGFQVTAPGASEDGDETLPEGVVLAAQFPSGVPLPPVKRLPAEFECPLCFKVKKFYKPSDWTKHVHEDVQPFTCTFPNCGEPKSFKRKADWVRHENERHRQLENWTCQIADCHHTCYRKDNFVQHLVREHKIAEPRKSNGRGNKEGTSSDQEEIWTIVDKCRRDTPKQPKDEPCRFCGNICTSWKKLTVHLAKHMEQISTPILKLVEQKQLTADSIISPVVEMPNSRKLSLASNRSPMHNNPSRYNPSLSLAPGIDPYSKLPPDMKSEVASAGMHTYPPPQMVQYRGPQGGQTNGYTNYPVSNGQSYPSQTYPGLQQLSKLNNNFNTGLQIPNQPFANGQYGVAPVSAMQQQSMYTDSPIDTTTFPNCFTQDVQNVTNDTTSISYNAPNGMQYQQQQQPQQGAWVTMAHLNAQHGYPYQGQ
ncbi:hypothetical protein ACEQ8H_005831 [Pleosporales sp. CAS-2024a]